MTQWVTDCLNESILTKWIILNQIYCTDSLRSARLNQIFLSSRTQNSFWFTQNIISLWFHVKASVGGRMIEESSRMKLSRTLSFFTGLVYWFLLPVFSWSVLKVFKVVSREALSGRLSRHWQHQVDKVEMRRWRRQTTAWGLYPVGGFFLR